MVTMPVRLRIAELLSEREMSQTDLARASGISLVTINAMASPKRRPKQIQLDSIDKLCAALDVEPGALFDRTDAKPATKRRRGKG